MGRTKKKKAKRERRGRRVTLPEPLPVIPVAFYAAHRGACTHRLRRSESSREELRKSLYNLLLPARHTPLRSRHRHYITRTTATRESREDNLIALACWRRQRIFGALQRNAHGAAVGDDIGCAQARVEGAHLRAASRICWRASALRALRIGGNAHGNLCAASRTSARHGVITLLATVRGCRAR